MYHICERYTTVRSPFRSAVRFLDLPEDTQNIFRLGRRLNIMGDLRDLQVPGRVNRVKEIMDQSGIDRTNIDTVCDQLMVRASPI